MLFEFEVKVVEADPNIKCNKCGKGFNVGTTIITRGYASNYGQEEYSRKHRIYHGSEGSRMYFHKRCT